MPTPRAILFAVLPDPPSWLLVLPECVDPVDGIELLRDAVVEDVVVTPPGGSEDDSPPEVLEAMGTCAFGTLDEAAEVEDELATNVAEVSPDVPGPT